MQLRLKQILVVIVGIICALSVYAGEEILVPPPMNKVDESHYKDLINRFVKFHGKDIIINKYFSSKSPLSTLASKEEKDNGCLDVKIANIYRFENTLLYELTCDCAKYNLLLESDNKSPHENYGVILVYINEDEKLERINLAPIANRWYANKNNKSVKQYHRFLKRLGIVPKERLREELATIYVYTVCHFDLGRMPVQVKVLRDQQSLTRKSIFLLVGYGDYDIKYLFTFDRSNNIIEVTATCD